MIKLKLQFQVQCSLFVNGQVLVQVSFLVSGVAALVLLTFEGFVVGVLHVDVVLVQLQHIRVETLPIFLTFLTIVSCRWFTLILAGLGLLCLQINLCIRH